MGRHFKNKKILFIFVPRGDMWPGCTHGGFGRGQVHHKPAIKHTEGEGGGTRRLSPLEPQSRFGDKPLKLLSNLSPKRDCGPKRVNLLVLVLV